MAKPPVVLGNFTTISTASQKSITKFLNSAVTQFGEKFAIRERMKEIDRAYLRQVDNTKETQIAREQNKNDPTKFQNVVIPVVKPQVEIAVAKLVETFLMGYPIFGVSAMPPLQDAGMQMETILADQQEHGGWSSELQSCFRDGKKYNLLMAEVDWKKEAVAAVANDVGSANTAKIVPDIYWEGNSIKRIDLYNAFWDLRPSPNKLHKEGEFAGFNELKSRIELIRLMWSLGNTQLNRTAALASTMGYTSGSAPSSTDYHIPDINPKAIVNAKQTAFNWSAWFGATDNPDPSIALSGAYVVTTLYARIVPQDHNMGVPAPKTPAVWKFIVVNGEHIIYCEQIRSAHDYLPIVLSTMDCGDLGYQETSLADEMTPMQSISSAYANGGVASMRKAVADRMFYDPSKIEKKDIENANPSSKIPVKSAHYGKPLNEAVYVVPYRDEISGMAFQGVQQLSALANQASGQNPAQQGQFVKGNKTLNEYADVMANASGRTVNTALNLENNFMTPIKEMLRLNILQFQKSGSLFNTANEQEVTIDPTMLRNATLKFKMHDGMSPASKIMSTEAFAVALQTISSSPALQNEFNLGDMTVFLLKQQRADVSFFQKPAAQKAYDSAVNDWRMIAQMIAEGKVQGQQVPPQPKPADYGWDPSNPEKSVPASVTDGKPAIMSQVAQASSPQQTNGTGNNPGTQPPTAGVS